MTCASCTKDQPLEAFRLKEGRRLKVCYECEAAERRGRYKAEVERNYNASVRGVARHLRNDHGYNYADSIEIATRMSDPFETCDICGLPNFWIGDGRAIWGGGRRIGLRRPRRLTCDHIEAGGLPTLGNTRLLCTGCNSAKSNRDHIWTDVQVLRAAQRWYERLYNPARLFWLHKVPGAGGRRFRNEFMQRKYQRLTRRALPMFGPLAAVVR